MDRGREALGWRGQRNIGAIETIAVQPEAMQAR
jgi:hypothetical protein